MEPLSVAKSQRLSDPVAATGDRLYSICTQNGLFGDSWSGHVPGRMLGVWDHPIKLLDGVWMLVDPPDRSSAHLLAEADRCTVFPTHLEFSYRVGPLAIVRSDFVPDGLEAMLFTWTLRQTEPAPGTLWVRLVVRPDLRPAWLGERVGMRDASDRARYETSSRCMVVRDRRNPWFAAMRAQPASLRWERSRVDPRVITPPPVRGSGLLLECGGEVRFDNHGEAGVQLIVAGSTVSAFAAIRDLDRLHSARSALLEEKRRRCVEILDTCSPSLPDERIAMAFQESKLGCQAVARHGELGTGVGAGLPEYPWWFGIDTTYTVPAMAQAGLFRLCADSLRLLHRASLIENPGQPGRVIHELSTTGVVFNAGNLVETVDFVRAVHRYWLWSGDGELVNELYPFCKQGLLEYTLGECDPDGDLCASGRSIIETLEMHAGFECVDVASYTWDALRALADLATATGDEAVIPNLHEKAAALGERLRSEWWIPDEGLFADVRASRREVIETLERLERTPLEHPDPDLVRQVENARRLFAAGLQRNALREDGVDLPWLLRHWVVLCPLEVGLATPAQAEAAFARLESSEFRGEWGMYLHPERKDVMSINTGLLAMAELRYGRPAEAMRLVGKMAEAATIRAPGSISEALPDRWDFLQLWSAVGIICPIVEGVFGLAPRASERRLRITGDLPADWPRAGLSRVRVGEAGFDVDVERLADGLAVDIRGNADFDLDLGCRAPSTVRIVDVRLNGNPAPWREEADSAGRRAFCRAQAPAHLGVRWR